MRELSFNGITVTPGTSVFLKGPSCISMRIVISLVLEIITPPLNFLTCIVGLRVNSHWQLLILLAATRSNWRRQFPFVYVSHSLWWLQKYSLSPLTTTRRHYIAFVLFRGGYIWVFLICLELKIIYFIGKILIRTIPENHFKNRKKILYPSFHVNKVQKLVIWAVRRVRRSTASSLPEPCCLGDVGRGLGGRVCR